MKKIFLSAVIIGVVFLSLAGAYFFSGNESLEQVFTKSECIRVGCSHEACVDSKEYEENPFATVCWVLPIFECFALSTCERQPDGECGWTRTEEFVSCLDQHERGDPSANRPLVADRSRIEVGRHSATELRIDFYNRHDGGLVGLSVSRCSGDSGVPNLISSEQNVSRGGNTSFLTVLESGDLDVGTYICAITAQKSGDDLDSIPVTIRVVP